MRRQNVSTTARRCRRFVTLGRIATWSGFGAAVLGLAALLAGGAFLTDQASPNTLRNAALAGGLAFASLAVVMLARRARRWAQSNTAALGRVPLRLVPGAEPSETGQRRRPAA
jgi:hypothetical protein